MGEKANLVCFVTLLAGAAELQFRSLLVCYKIRRLSPSAYQVALVVKNLLTNAGDIRDVGSISGLGRAPGGGQDHPLHYSCLEDPHGQRSLMGYSQSIGLQRVTHD